MFMHSIRALGSSVGRRSVLRGAGWLALAFTAACSQAEPAVEARGQGLTERDEALAALGAVAAARGYSIAAGSESYVRAADTVLAHAPLEGIAEYTDESFAAGAPLMVVHVNEGVPGRIPNGTYLVTVQHEPGAQKGWAHYSDQDGNVVVSVPATLHAPSNLDRMFPGSYSDPEPPMIPVITSTHVWVPAHGNIPGHWGVDCTGWQPIRTIYY